MYEIINVKGVTLIFSPFQNIETASLGIFLRIGSRFEKSNVKGIAHFLEHMLFKGSDNYSYRQIKREIEGRGGSLNGFTSQEISGYYARFLNKNTLSTLNILLDMVSNPLLRELDINKERNVILEEIKMYNDLPSSRVIMLIDQLLWKGHPLGEEVLGYVSTVNNIRRSDLNNFKNKYYMPSNMIVSFCGAFSKEKIISLLEKKVKKDSYKVNLNPQAPSSCRGIRVKIENKKLEQFYLCLGFRSVPYSSKDRLIVHLVNVILGANMSSRLFEELREKKSLCYDVSTEVRKYKDSGAFLIHAGLDKRNVIKAIVVISKELNKIKEEQISRKELSRAKDYLLGQIAMNLERPQGRMFYLAESYVALGQIQDLGNIKAEINSITPSRIKKISQEIFKFGNACVSCVGDARESLEADIGNVIVQNSRIKVC